MKPIIALVLLAVMLPLASAKEFHVSVNGDDSNKGSASKPLKTISAAALVAQPGDAITVHQGTYRERVNPPRGGESDAKRITYQAAKGGLLALTRSLAFDFAPTIRVNTVLPGAINTWKRLVAKYIDDAAKLLHLRQGKGPLPNDPQRQQSEHQAKR